MILRILWIMCILWTWYRGLRWSACGTVNIRCKRQVATCLCRCELLIIFVMPRSAATPPSPAAPPGQAGKIWHEKSLHGDKSGDSGDGQRTRGVMNCDGRAASCVGRRHEKGGRGNQGRHSQARRLVCPGDRCSAAATGVY